MQIFQSPHDFQRWADTVRMEGGCVGLVPTMGALHQGHLSLIDGATARQMRPAVTIFINPKQFGPGEDLQRYPRSLEADLRLCRSRAAACVFTPEVPAMYPPGESTTVSVSGPSQGLCGAARPGHFDGVSTVVCKLFALAGPCTAFFGRKDYQQLKVIQQMVRDLFLPVQVVGMPIVREADGLAMSSRNRYLDSEQRNAALGLVRALGAAADAFGRGERSKAALLRVANDALRASGVRADYVSLNDPETLKPVAAETVSARVLLALAGFVGSTRLIDNLVLGEESSPLQGGEA